MFFSEIAKQRGWAGRGHRRFKIFRLKLPYLKLLTVFKVYDPLIVFSRSTTP
jgi:hypothetical protein